MTDQGKANYEGYHASIPGASFVPFEELPHLERLHWDAGAVSVEMSLADQDEHDESPLPDDAPEPAKVIIVECDGKPARLFAATGWEVVASGSDAGDLALVVDGDEWVAQIGARHWDTVAKAEAILPADLYARTGKKLALALDALREMREHGDEAAAEVLAAIEDVDL